MKITSLKLVIVFVTISLICILWIFIANNSDKICAEIYVDDRLVRTVTDLSREDITSFEVKTDWGSNVIEYGCGKIWVKESDCENQTCVNFGEISASGQVIICAPHRLTVRLTGQTDEQTDVRV